MKPPLKCQFYTKIGACRHGDKCSKAHVKPLSLKVVLLPHLYNPKTMASLFDEVLTDMFVKLASYGEIRAMVVCENESSHLNGNVYVRYDSQALAEAAVRGLNDEWFAQRPVHCELTPVDSFNESVCRAHHTNSCSRGDHCNYMHVKLLDPQLMARLFQSQDKLILLKRVQQSLQPPPQPKPETTAPELSTFNVLSEMFS